MALREYLATGSGYLLRTGMIGANPEPGLLGGGVEKETRDFSRMFDCNAMMLVGHVDVYDAAIAAWRNGGVEAGRAVIDAARERYPSIGGGADKLDPAERKRLEDDLASRQEQWLAICLASIEQGRNAEEAMRGMLYLRPFLQFGSEPYTRRSMTLWTILDPVRDGFPGVALPEGSPEEQVVRRLWERFGKLKDLERSILAGIIDIRGQAIGQCISRLSKIDQGRPRCQQKTPEQLERLEELFEQHAGEISIAEARAVAAEIGLEKGEQVKNWFAQQRKKRGISIGNLWERNMEKQLERQEARFAPY